MQKILDCVREGVGGWKYSLQASCIEIYNDKLRDLFSMHGDDNRSKALQIKHDVDGSTFVTNITTVAVEEVWCGGRSVGVHDIGHDRLTVLESREVAGVFRLTKVGLWTLGQRPFEFVGRGSSP